MARSRLSCVRRGATLIATALLAASGPLACGVAGPSPRLHQDSAPAAPGVEHQPPPPAVATADDASGRQLLLRLGQRRLYLMEGDPGTPVASFPIAVGRKGLETPTGHYHVEEMIENPDFVKIARDPAPRVVNRIPPGPENPLGVRWIGFAHGQGWTLGIHGTPHPELLGQAVSHGCVRMRNADVLRVYESIHIGTPVVVVP